MGPGQSSRKEARKMISAPCIPAQSDLHPALSVEIAREEQLGGGGGNIKLDLV